MGIFMVSACLFIKCYSKNRAIYAEKPRYICRKTALYMQKNRAIYARKSLILSYSKNRAIYAEKPRYICNEY
jgi:hypothetical protein